MRRDAMWKRMPVEWSPVLGVDLLVYQRRSLTLRKENYCMDNIKEEKLAPEAKPVELSSQSQVISADKFVAQRIANKKRKRKAHRRKLRRSHTKG
jgi:hypothetical protein